MRNVCFHLRSRGRLCVHHYRQHQHQQIYELLETPRSLSSDGSQRESVTPHVCLTGCFTFSFVTSFICWEVKLCGHLCLKYADELRLNDRLP